MNATDNEPSNTAAQVTALGMVVTLNSGMNPE